MRLLVSIIITFICVCTLSARPFSKWHLDRVTQLNFDDEACYYDFETDDTVSAYQYYNSDILTDTAGEFLYRFDNYKSKIEIRDNDNNLISEVTITDVSNSRKYLNTIVLPFYNEQKCFYLMLESRDDNSSGSLSYFEFDFSTTPPNIGPLKNIPTPELLESVLAATINNSNDGYYLALSNAKLNELIVLDLKSNGDATSQNYPVSIEDHNNISSREIAKFSPQGDKLILNNHSSYFHFFDFDNSNGVATHKFTTNFKDDIGFNIRGEFAFSQDGKKLYTQSGHGKYIIHQFNLIDYEKEKIHNSRIEVWSVDGECVECLIRDFRLAPNNKIYVSYSSSRLNVYTNDKLKSYLGVINCPNALGEDTDFEFLGVTIPHYVNSSAHLQLIPSNFQATPEPAAEFERFEETLYFCKGGKAVINGVDDPCGEHKWFQLSGERHYTKDLIIDNFDESYTGDYFYQFTNCYQTIRDTFSIELLDSLRPEIVMLSPDEVELCKTSISQMEFSTKDRYDNYTWYFTELGQTNRQEIGTDDTIKINKLGLLELVVSSENGCTGIAEYKIEPPNIEFGEIKEYEFVVCRGGDVIFDMEYFIESDRPLRIDSIKFSNNNSMYVANSSWLEIEYPTGVFDKTLNLGYSSFALGIERDTLEIYIYSDCYKTIRIPLKVITTTNQYTLEIPNLRTYIGAKNFEIPIYLTSACVEDYTDLDFEATISLSNKKYFIESTSGINLLNQWEDNENTNIRFSYSNQISTNGRVKIGSLYGLVLLTDQDSTEIHISDTSSNYILELKHGSLVTDSICAQDIRQVEFFNKDDISIFNDANSLILESIGEYKGKFTISLFSYNGSEVFKLNTHKNSGMMSERINLLDISSGVYFVKIEISYGVIVKKIFLMTETH